MVRVTSPEHCRVAKNLAIASGAAAFRDRLRST